MICFKSKLDKIASVENVYKGCYNDFEYLNVDSIYCYKYLRWAHLKFSEISKCNCNVNFKGSIYSNDYEKQFNLNIL